MVVSRWHIPIIFTISFKLAQLTRLGKPQLFWDKNIRRNFTQKLAAFFYLTTLLSSVYQCDKNAPLIRFKLN